MRIGVYGLGYVGCVNATCFANRGHMVIGVDVDQRKIDLINAGLIPVKEQGLDELLATAVADGRLRATTDAVGTVLATDMSIVCVGTPSDVDGSPRLEFVAQVAEQIGEGLRDLRSRHLVVFRSTVLPRTLEGFLIPRLATASRRMPGSDFSVVFHPEFLREGTALYDFEHPPTIIVGHLEHDTWGRDLLSLLYTESKAPITSTSIGVAEMVKHVSNSFHALKVAFANEIGNICKEQGIDSHEVMRIFCEDTKLNLSPDYLRPGPAFGGSCLPKDLRAFLYHARAHDVQVPLLEAISVSNELQKERVAQLVHHTGKRRIGILGLTFKAGTDDLRESPSVELVKSLHGKGYDLSVYDPNVCVQQPLSANWASMEHELPYLASLLRDSMREVLQMSEVVLVTNRDPEFATVASNLQPEQILIDLVRLPSPDDHVQNYVGISW